MMRARYPLNALLSVPLDCFDKFLVYKCNCGLVIVLLGCCVICMNALILSFYRKNFQTLNPSILCVQDYGWIFTHTRTHTLMLDVFLFRERLKRYVSGGENKTWRHTQKKYQMSLMSLNMFYYHISGWSASQHSQETHQSFCREIQHWIQSPSIRKH